MLAYIEGSHLFFPSLQARMRKMATFAVTSFSGFFRLLGFRELMTGRNDMPVRILGGLALFLIVVACWVMPHETRGQDKTEAKTVQSKKAAAPYATAHAKPLDSKE